MTIDEIAQKYQETCRAIFLCNENKCNESVLVLLYSAIDALSWLYSERNDINKRSVKQDYKRWVNKFFLPNLDGYDCTAHEIYLARCSILHTNSAGAKNQNDNRIFVYVYGDKDNEMQVRNMIDEYEKILGKKLLFVVHVGDFVKALEKGINDFFECVKESKNLFNSVIKKTEKYYVSFMPSEAINI